MKYEFTIEDNEFGTIYVRANKQIKTIKAKIIDGCLVLTAPPLFSPESTVLLNIIDNNREGLRRIINYNQNKENKYIINPDFSINTDFLTLNITCTESKHLKIKHSYHLSNNTIDHCYITLLCPIDTDFNSSKQQQWLQKVLEKAIRNFSTPYIEDLMKQMSQLSGFHCETISVNSAHSRWGSCGRDPKHAKDTRTIFGFLAPTPEIYLPHKINISLYAALLPRDLTKFILLHELTHTKFRNHSKDFHFALNKLTISILGQPEKYYNKLIKPYKTTLGYFAQQSNNN